MKHFMFIFLEQMKCSLIFHVTFVTTFLTHLTETTIFNEMRKTSWDEALKMLNIDGEGRQ